MSKNHRILDRKTLKTQTVALSLLIALSGAFVVFGLAHNLSQQLSFTGGFTAAILLTTSPFWLTESNPKKAFQKTLILFGGCFLLVLAGTACAFFPKEKPVATANDQR